MIRREFIRCKVCGQFYTLRIYVTSLNEVTHSFFCYSCAQSISYRIRKRSGQLLLSCIANCTKTKREGLVVNISTEFPISKDIVHADKIFPWFHFIQKALSENPEEFKSVISRRPTPDHLETGDLEKIIKEETQEAFRRRLDLKDQWKIVGTTWSLYNDRKGEECYKYIEKHYRTLGYQEHPHPKDLIVDFLGRRTYHRGANVFKNLVELWSSAWKTNSQECGRFLIYFCTNNDYVRTLKFMHDFVSSYMNNYDELMQLHLIYVFDLTVGDELILGSNNFQAVQSFYGDAFERCSELLYIPTCMKNIAEGRSFDRLTQIDLETYLGTEKARRAENLRTMELLDCLTSTLDPKIRNASHHARIRFDKTSLRITLKPSSKSKEHEITYISYIDKCNQIVQATYGLYVFSLQFLYESVRSLLLAQSLGVSIELPQQDMEMFTSWLNDSRPQPERGTD
ncbi:hypothetical protein KQX64_18630 [Rhodopseudomonas palustris]|nr:hypothetical protein KQX64_18630 [Rhodopseudomonas palustris]